MYDATFWSNIINSLVWPFAVLFILILFRVPIINLIYRIKNIKGPGFNVEIGDTIPYYDPTDKTLRTGILTPFPMETSRIEKLETKKLTPAEEEASKIRAQARLDDDTKKFGYQRGELIRHPDGRWAINWKVEAAVQLGIKSG